MPQNNQAITEEQKRNIVKVSALPDRKNYNKITTIITEWWIGRLTKET